MRFFFLSSRLCITEEEYSADFSVEVRFSGRISATITARNNTNGYYKYIEGDLVTIFGDALRSGIPGATPGQFEIHEQTQTVRAFLLGKCAFRYGIEQHVNVEQKSLNEYSSMINNDSPPKYQPLRPSPNVH